VTFRGPPNPMVSGRVSPDIGEAFLVSSYPCLFFLVILPHPPCVEAPYSSPVRFPGFYFCCRKLPQPVLLCWEPRTIRLCLRLSATHDLHCAPRRTVYFFPPTRGPWAVLHQFVELRPSTYISFLLVCSAVCYRIVPPPGSAPPEVGSIQPCFPAERRR